MICGGVCERRKSLEERLILNIWGVEQGGDCLEYTNTGLIDIVIDTPNTVEYCASLYKIN